MIAGIEGLLKCMDTYPGAAFGLAVFTFCLVGGIGNMFRRR